MAFQKRQGSYTGQNRQISVVLYDKNYTQIDDNPVQYHDSFKVRVVVLFHKADLY